MIEKITRIGLVLITFLTSDYVFGQVKVGDNPTQINANAIMELESANKGVLLPRIALTSTSSPSPMSAFVAGMVVYNTATAGDVVPGFYVSNGLSWTKIDNQSGTTYTGSTSVTLNGTSFERAALTGDVTATANSNATTIANDAVTYSKMQNVSANNRILGRATTGAGDVEEITLGTGLSLSGTTLNATGDLRLVNTASHISQDAGVGSNGTSAGSNESIMIGSGAGNSNSGQRNIFIGHEAGNANTNATNLVFMGYQAGKSNTTGVRNTFVGNLSGTGNTTANGNTGFGFESLKTNSTGNNNTAFGTYTLTNNTLYSNTAIGFNALNTNNGHSNTVVGAAAMETETTGNHNTVLGASAGWRISGNENILIGSGSGWNLTTGSKNIIIGRGINAPTATGNAQLTIGNLIFGTGVDGDGGSLATGNIGIGVVNPSQKLEVAGAIRFSGALMPNNTAGTTGQVLTSAGAGAVPTWTTLPTATTFTGSTSVALNGTSFERAALTGDVTASQNSNTLTIANDAVTYSKMQNVSTNNIILGRATSGSGDVEEITLGTGLTLTGTTLTANGDLRLVNTSSHITQDAGVGSNGTSAGGEKNIFIGLGAGNANSGTDNVFIGNQAGNANTTTPKSVFIGANSGKSNTTAERNTFVGYNSGQAFSTGGENTAIGYQALQNNSIGTNNTALGSMTLIVNTGSNNTALGGNSLVFNTGNANTAVGALAMLNGNAGNHNTVLGTSAAWQLTGNDNVILGSNSGNNLTTGSKNILIGRNINAPVATGSNQLSIGNLIYGTNVDGDGSTISTGNIGIGVTAPSQKLEVGGAIRFSGALMPNNTAGTAGQVLTSAGAGVVPTWTTLPTSTTYTGSTSVALNGTSFERAALTGDVTATANSNSTTIATNAVTSAKILDGTVATADIADNAITKNKLENNIAIPGTANMTLPGGTTAERPTVPSAGMIRYNSTLGKTEVYQGGTWVTIDATSVTASNGLTLSSGDVKLGGTLTAATTTIDMGTNKMAFNSTASSGAGHFNIDGSTFSVDAALNRVGIGTQTPGFTLDVTGTLRVTSTTNLATTALNNNPLYLRSDANHGLIYNGTADGPRLYGFGGGFLGTQNGTNAIFWNSSGNVGVGNSAPSEKLDVTGNVRFSGALMPNNAAGTSGQVLTSAGAGAPPTWATPASATNIYNTDGSLTGSRTVSQGTNNLAFTSTATTGTSHFTIDGTTFNVNAVNNRIGLGIAAPVDLLHLQAQGGRKIVISNNGGITNNEDIGGITWRDGDGTGTLMGNIIVQGNSGSTGDGSSRMVIGTRTNDNSTTLVETMTIHSNGNVGLGVITPAEKLHVVGNIRSSSLAGSGSRMVVADANGTISTTAIPSSTTYTGSTSVTLNGTSFERAALTGDVTAAANNNATTIANDAVTYAKMQNVSTNNRLLGRATTGAGDMEEITLGTGLSFSGTTLNAATGNTLYTADGSLAGNRTVTQGTNTLAFTSSATTGTSHFTVDGTTLNVDAVNNRIGIGTATPTQRFTVVGGSISPAVGNASDAGIYFPANPGGGSGDEAFIRYYAETGENTKLMIGNSNDTDDDISFFQNGAERLTIFNGNIGVGTTAPEEKMHINVAGSNAIKIGNVGNANGALFLGGGGTSGVVNWIDFFNESGTKRGNVYFDQTNGFVVNNTGSNTNIGGTSGARVGINTFSPTSTLDVDGGILARGNNSISNQGIHLQWNRSGTDGESWILNQKGGGTSNSGIRFGTVTTANAATEWARFMDNGNYGINQTNPQARLHVGGNSIVDGMASVYGTASISAQGLHLAWNRSGGGGESWIINQRGLGGGGIRFGTSDQSNNVTELARIENNGNFGIGRNDPSHPLHMGSGAHVTTAGNWTNASDLRLKKNIENSKYGLSDLLKLRPVDYQMKSNSEKQVGFIAQEVKKIIPEVVSGDENSDVMMGVSYGNLVPVLVNAIKEQQAQIEKMQKEIEELKKDKK
jgi:hypothetical protein